MSSPRTRCGCSAGPGRPGTKCSMFTTGHTATARPPRHSTVTPTPQTTARTRPPAPTTGRAFGAPSHALTEYLLRRTCQRVPKGTQ
jgi:hypothetical protein